MKALKFKVGDTATELVKLDRRVYPNRLGFRSWKVVAVGTRYYTLQRESTIYPGKFFHTDYGFLRGKRHLYTDDEVLILRNGYAIAEQVKQKLFNMESISLAINVSLLMGSCIPEAKEAIERSRNGTSVYR